MGWLSPPGHTAPRVQGRQPRDGMERGDQRPPHACGGTGSHGSRERTQPCDRKRMKPCACVSFSSHGLCGSKHPACTQPRAGERMGRTCPRRSDLQDDGMGSQASATRTQAKQHHVDPDPEPGLGGGQTDASCPTGAPGSLPFPTTHPKLPVPPRHPPPLLNSNAARGYTPLRKACPCLSRLRG